MSRRTSEANKAVAAAWAKEQALVQKGKGTRDWTSEQQQDILERGKAYDENRKAFEGHHMKSAEKYPENQGNLENIQFLSRSEHFKAHNGSFQNPTNGFYDYLLECTIPFEKNITEPCAVIDLTEPIYMPTIEVEGVDSENIVTLDKGTDQEVPEHYREHHGNLQINKSTTKPKVKKSFMSTIRKGFEATVNFSKRHPVLTGIVGTVAAGVIAKATDNILNGGKSSPNNKNSSYSPNLSNDKDYEYLNDEEFEDIEATDDIEERDYPDDRLPPSEHTVRSHPQRYHTKEGTVWMEKDPYPRGGKNQDE